LHESLHRRCFAFDWQSSLSRRINRGTIPIRPFLLFIDSSFPNSTFALLLFSCCQMTTVDPVKPPVFSQYCSLFANNLPFACVVNLTTRTSFLCRSKSFNQRRPQ
jgi:hypothetical protein